MFDTSHHQTSVTEETILKTYDNKPLLMTIQVYYGGTFKYQLWINHYTIIILHFGKPPLS